MGFFGLFGAFFGFFMFLAILYVDSVLAFTEKDKYDIPDGCFAEFPVGKDGKERLWGLRPEVLIQKIKKGYVRFGPYGILSVKREGAL